MVAPLGLGHFFLSSFNEESSDRTTNGHPMWSWAHISSSSDEESSDYTKFDTFRSSLSDVDTEIDTLISSSVNDFMSGSISCG